MDFSQKKIAVVGLGLIGGSFCKTIRKHVGAICWGLDTDASVTAQALAEGTISRVITEKELPEADITIIALHPRQTIAFISTHADCFQKGSIVLDVCGVKSTVINAAEQELQTRSVRFVGTHPMAGREFSGYEYALDDLFDRASFIITPTRQTDETALETVIALAEEMRFQQVVISSPEDHDRIIAFTSQLAHVVSNAYIKSPTAQEQMGFSAGSFQDLTRVAKLNENMWTDLFLMNKEPLLYELDTIITHLSEYREALATENAAQLRKLLRCGRILKEKSMQK